MRFTTAIVASVFALAANAQTTESVTSVVSTAVSTEVTSATTTREPTPEESLQADMIECIDACDPDDVNCKANCITVPNPDATAVNETTSCVADCPQGRGSKADNEAYGQCVQSCIDQHYLTTTFTGQPTGEPTNTGGSSQGGSEATPTPSVSTVTSGSSTYETTVTPTASGGSASETEGASENEPTDAPNAGAMPFSPLGATGLLGLVAAFFAL
ncbi:hypothetical protein DL765_005140 [Monosporascus sp. GIB2]|nr:hypothetical protein DL765_005140 [Monosporascus sp. GIB2]